jgi:malate dehydrogenase (oxaloacetate-decarboxylating)
VIFLLGTPETGSGQGEQQVSQKEDWYALALKYSKHYAGKVDVVPKVPITSLRDFSYWYTPGVAAVSMAINKNKELAFELTGKWNTIGVVGDGSRVLGLGNIGGEAALPVLEGKSLIFKYLGGVNAVPLPLSTQEPRQIENTVKSLEAAFGGINLEDIESPKCFTILDDLRREMNIPVWHDDQQGTAGAALAALINSLKITSRKLENTKIVLFGVGAANIATSRLLAAAGADLRKMVLVDSKGILHAEREDLDQLMLKHPRKYELALKTNGDKLKGGLEEALKGADVLIAASTPGPGVIKKEWIKGMNKEAIVFAQANPVPEIWPWELKEVGVKIIATGRSDFPNQVNNSLVFPAVFRGALDSRARTVSDEMVVAASMELARFAEEKGLRDDYIIPTMQEWEVYPRVASVVATKAVEKGLARRVATATQFHDEAKETIKRVRHMVENAMNVGLIEPLP